MRCSLRCAYFSVRYYTELVSIEFDAEIETADKGKIRLRFLVSQQPSGKPAKALTDIHEKLLWPPKLSK